MAKATRFVVCVDNSGYRASLELHKIYRVVRDAGAEDDGDLTRGLTVTPGFIDAQSHPLLFSEAIGVNVGFPSIVEVQRALATKAAATPSGHWVEGIMYDDTKFIEPRPLTRLDIDARWC